MKRKFLNIALSTICAITLSTNLVYAVTKSEATASKNEAEEKKTQAQSELNSINSEKTSTESEIDTLNNEIDKVQEEIDQYQVQLDNLNNEISNKQIEIDEKTDEIAKKEELLKKRLVTMYKTGNSSYLDVLLGSSNYIDMLSNYDAVKQIADADTELINTITTQKEEIESNKKELETQKQEVDTVKTQKQAKNDVLESKKSEKKEAVSKLSADAQAKQKEIDEYTAQIRQAYNDLAAIARAEAEVAKKKSSSSSSAKVYTGGQLNMPCNYTRIMSRFGYRGSAATGGVGSSNHKGIDFAAPKGNNIFAAEDGVVIKVSHTCTHNYAKTYKTRCSCGGGFGNYVMVSHGNGLVTLYGHCTDIYVGVGDTVSRGQTIATVGCTGYSTGNHLHFSVLLNGSYVNPASYLGM